MLIGKYPTPVALLPALSRGGTSLWVKRDDLTNPEYGGNKVRKIEKIVPAAQAKGAKRIITVGAVGSNYVLAMGVFARKVGLEVEAAIVAQPRTRHVTENLRADLAQGVKLTPARSYAHAAAIVLSRIARGSYYVPAGGSNVHGASGYVDAALEMARQVEAGEMPEPDLVVVALGSGGTVGGLTAGIAAAGMRTRVVGVTVAEPAWIAESQARALAKRCARGKASKVLDHLEIDRRYRGPGYGHPTEEARRAMAEGAKVGLSLDLTYTAKTFAAALDRVAKGDAKTVLYWHTLSSAPMGPLLTGAPEEGAIDARIRALLLAQQD